MKIGRILKNGIVEKEYFRQGYIYKNYDNFKNKKGICYIAEYQSDKIDDKSIEGIDYETYDSMMKHINWAYETYKIDETKYSKELMLDSVFEGVDWQHFSTLLDEFIECLDDECFLEK